MKVVTVNNRFKVRIDCPRDCPFLGYDEHVCNAKYTRKELFKDCSCVKDLDSDFPSDCPLEDAA